MQARRSARKSGVSQAWLRLAVSLTVGLMALTSAPTQNCPDIVWMQGGHTAYSAAFSLDEHSLASGGGKGHPQPPLTNLHSRMPDVPG